MLQVTSGDPSGTSTTPESLRETLNAVCGGGAEGAAKRDAALLLLTLRSAEPNVARLARRLALPYPFVARCLRRLVDNGVIADGQLVCLWSTGEWNCRAFWADVKVALGLCCRRVDRWAGYQWAPAARLRKNYDFVVEPEATIACEARYHLVPPDDDEAEEHTDLLSLPVRERQVSWMGGGMEPLWGAAAVGGAGVEVRGWTELGASKLDDGGAVWLS